MCRQFVINMAHLHTKLEVKKVQDNDENNKINI